MKYVLENAQYRIRVDSRGAQLQGIYDKNLKKEFMWQPGAEIWTESSLLLFPYPGRVSRDRLIMRGQEYPATMHGFAKDMDFEKTEQTADHLVLTLRNSEETAFYYPWAFELKVIFSLEETRLVQQFEIHNPNEDTMYFSFGAHPGFYCPIDLDETGDDYVICFDRPQDLHKVETEAGTRLLTGHSEPWHPGEKEIPLSEHFFDQGPMMFENMHADTISLVSRRSGRFVEVGIQDFPYLCLWGAPYRMHLICFEPWCGINDLAEYDHRIEHKKGIEILPPGETFCRTLTFRVG